MHELMESPPLMNPLPPRPAPDRATLTPLVRQALDLPAAEVLDWEVTLLHAAPGDPPRRSVYRVAGTARAGAQIHPWALTLKVLRGPAPGAADADPADWAYWKREPAVYQAGVLDGVRGGLRPVRCFAVSEESDNVIALWLEDLSACTATPWPVDRYALAARHLGAFNGAYLAGQAVPAQPWLAPDWLRSRIAHLATRMSLLRDPATWADPLVRQAFPDPLAGHLLRLWAERESYLGALARLPQTLCHRDAWRGNLFACRTATGAEETVAIDWALVGPSAVGEEISVLVWVTLLEFQVAPTEAARLEDAVYYSYLAGLAEAGWAGDPRRVRLAYAANAALQWAVFPEAITHALDRAGHAALEAHYGRPIAQIVAQSAAVAYLALDRAAEARELLWLADE